MRRHDVLTTRGIRFHLVFTVLSLERSGDRGRVTNAVAGSGSGISGRRGLTLAGCLEDLPAQRERFISFPHDLDPSFVPSYTLVAARACGVRGRLIMSRRAYMCVIVMRSVVHGSARLDRVDGFPVFLFVCVLR